MRENGQIGISSHASGLCVLQLVNTVNKPQSLVRSFNTENIPYVYIKILIFT